MLRVNVLGFRVNYVLFSAVCLTGWLFMMWFFIIILHHTHTMYHPIITTTEEVPMSKQAVRLAVLVPFRDRFEELLEFVPHMHYFLKHQRIKFDIFIIQQTDSNRFNRASLINVGYQYTRYNHEYFAMHDVDLLPLNPQLKYDFPLHGPMHISSPQTHPKYHYDTFIGGILLITGTHFEAVNGMSNNYWGWGLEDDEFYIRLKDAGIPVFRPKGITTGTTNTFKHIHNKNYRHRDTRKCYNQREVTRRRDKVTGLKDVAYNLGNVYTVKIDDIPCTVVNVELICNKTATPWCQCPPVTEKAAKKV